VQTEFEISTRFVCWGERLDPTQLAGVLELEPSFCTTKFKGEVLKQADDNHTTSFAKTGMFTYSYDKQYPDSRRNPDVQFEFITSMLKKIPGILKDKYYIEKAEVQIFLFYETVLPGDVDFFVPDALLLELSKHQIQLRITVLP